MPFSLSELSKFLRLHRSGFAVVSLLVGIITGLVCVLFRYLIAGWSWLMTGYTQYDAHQGPANGNFPWLNSWFLILVPVISSLIYGPMIYRWAPSARGHGIPEVMLAVRRKGGKIPGAVAIVKLLASVLTIGGGGSAGREGPVVQIGAALGSWWGKLISLDSNRMKMLVACGAAAGIAATFNAPLAGSVFALEVILATFTGEAFGMMVIAAVGASVVSHLLLGDELVVQLPTNLKLLSNLDFGWVFLLGIAGGLIGVGFSKLLYKTEDIMDWIFSKIPLREWARPLFFSVPLGLMLVLLPDMYGSGPKVQSLILQGSYSIQMLLLFLFARAIYTAFTMGMGGSGGVFAPSLFIGAATGCAMGQAISNFAYSPAATFGVIAMGAVFTGAARAPMTAVLIIMEMTGQYSLVLPLMLAISVATGTSRFLTRKTIYTEKLLRRGDILDDPVSGTLLGRMQAQDIMEPIPGEIHAEDTISDAAKMFKISKQESLPVIESKENPEFLGCLSALRVVQLQAEGLDPDTLVRDLPLDSAHCLPQDLPSQLLPVLLESRAPGLPVVGNKKLCGWISQKELISRIYRQQRRALEKIANDSSFGSRWIENHPNGWNIRDFWKLN